MLYHYIGTVNRMTAECGVNFCDETFSKTPAWRERLIKHYKNRHGVEVYTECMECGDEFLSLRVVRGDMYRQQYCGCEDQLKQLYVKPLGNEGDA